MAQKHSLFNMTPIKEARCFFSEEGEVKNIPKLFNILSWNVNKQCDAKRWREEIDFIRHAYEPALLLFQEVNFTPSLEQFIKEEQYHYGFTPNLSLDRERKAFAGVATVSRMKAVNHEGVLTRGSEPFLNTPKPLLYSQYVLFNETILTVINLHGINFVRLKTFTQQMEQIEELITHSPGPVIVAGDFNLWSHGRQRIVTKLFEAHPEMAFKEVDFREHVHHIKRAPKLIQKMHGYHHLDRIFYSSSSLRPVEETAHVHRVLNGQELVSSDHYPISCSFITLEKKGPQAELSV